MSPKASPLIAEKKLDLHSYNIIEVKKIKRPFVVFLLYILIFLYKNIFYKYEIILRLFFIKNY